MPTLNLSKDDAELAALVEKALAGEEAVVAREGKPLVRLVPVETIAETSSKRQFGQWAGRIKVHGNLKDPLPEEVMRAFRGEAE